MVGGKWTTFRAFAEMASDRVMACLSVKRTVSTRNRKYPGFPVQGSGDTIANLRVKALLTRYGEIGREIADYCSGAPDKGLASLPDYSRREIEWLIQRRSACTLEDLVVRRMDIVLSDRVSRRMLEELAAIQATTLGRADDWAAAQVAQVAADPRVSGFSDGKARAAA